MSVDLPVNISTAEAERLRQVILGREEFATINSTYEGRPFWVLVARGDTIAQLKARLTGDVVEPPKSLTPTFVDVPEPGDPRGNVKPTAPQPLGPPKVVDGVRSNLPGRS